MYVILFECESVTPIFMYGADGKTPELRPASIKGLMRFWWRAINGDLSLDELKKQEDEIFGSTDRRSKVIIYPIDIISESDFKISPTPHHKTGYCNDDNKNCFYRNKQCMKANKKRAKIYEFNIKMSIKSNEYLDKDSLIELFKISTLLGGFGQRSRRGFGSIQVNGSEVLTSPNDIEILIKKINPNFTKKPEKQENEQYPYIKDIQIGKAYQTFQDLLETIGRASHNNNCDELGSINPRLASPIYVSILKFGDNNYRPIITTLKNTNYI